jgi:hypothetical protein
VFARQPELRVCDGAEVSWRFDPSRIDQLAFGDDHPFQAGLDFGTSALYKAWFLRNPSIYTFLLAEGRLVGYVNAMPLVDAAFQAVLNGRCNDGHIDPAWIRAYDEPGSYRVYLSTIAVLPDFRRVSAFWLLAMAFRKKADSLRERGIVVEELASVVWTDEGCQICKALGMRHLGPHRRKGDVYYGRLEGSRLPDCLPDSFTHRARHRAAGIPQPAGQS